MHHNKALVFGVTGQDGSYLSELLLSKGYKVVGVTRRCSVDNTERLGKIINNDNFLVLEGDVSDFVSVNHVFTRASLWFGGPPNEVYSLAAQSHVGTSFEQPTSTWQVNAVGPLNILETIYSNRDYSLSRFYQASTSEMFGNNFTVLPDGKRVQDENTVFAPTSPYAIAKVAAHHTLEYYRKAYNIFACGGILFNHESPRRGEKFVTRKITKYVGGLYHIKRNCCCTNTAFCEHPKLKLGNLKACRDWGYAPDYVNAMWLMLQQGKPEDYVIGTGETHSVEEFCKIAFDCINEDWHDWVEVDSECMRPSDVEYLCSNPVKANEHLGWETSITFKELVELMVKADIDVYRN